MTRAWPVVAIVAIGACGTSRSPSPTAHATGAAASSIGRNPVPAPIDANRIRNLAFLALDAPLEPRDLSRVHDELASGKLTLDRFVDDLLADDRFPQTATRILINDYVTSTPTYPFPRGYILRATAPDATGRSAYFLRGKPCEVSRAVPVRPWWAPEREVLICPDDYRPGYFADAAGHLCDSVRMAPGETSSDASCGCGPNLMRCTPDRERYQRLLKSSLDEVALTAEAVVREDRPLSDLFTSNATFRNRDAEFLYQRWRVEAGELSEVPDLTAWPVEGRWAPRWESRPGQHAGIITTTPVVFRSTGLRAILKDVFEKAWCVEAESVNVSSAMLMSLGVVDLRAAAGWKKLAGMPVCETCHAKMDYGVQFFQGYSDNRVAQHFFPAKQLTTTGPFFGRDTRDHRATGQLTPLGFAHILVGQPEFDRCMAKNVTDHVFNHRASPEDVSAVLEAMKRTGSARAMMKVALLRYATHPLTTSGPAKAEPPPKGQAPDADDTLAVPAAIRRRLDDHCDTCHQSPGDPLKPAFDGERLPRKLIASILSDVAFGRMPKNGDFLSPEERRGFADDLVDLLWTEETLRLRARDYFVEHARGLPTHRASSVLRLVRARAGAPNPPAKDLNLVEGQIRQSVSELTPGLSIMIGLEAVRACAASGKTGDARARCIQSSTSPFEMFNGTSP